MRAGRSTVLMACGLAAALPALPVSAAIDIQPKVAVVRGSPATIEIFNEGDRPEYVSISLSRLLNPGAELAEERLEPITDTPDPPLYAHPFRLALAPGQSKTVFLKPLKAVEQEQVYRLELRPVISPQDPRRQGVAGSVVVSLAFSALVRQLPAKESAQLSLACEAQGARLSASGNTRVQVKGATVDKRAVEPFNVYPGVPKLLQGSQISIPDQPPCLPGAHS